MCPHCGAALIVLEFEGVEVDYCLSCGGIWLDMGELEQIAFLAGADPERVLAGLAAESKRMPETKVATEGKSPPATRAAEGGRKCIRCAAPLREFAWPSPEKPVVIDSCPRACGFWFDKGELEAVMSSCEEGAGGNVARFFATMFGAQGSTPSKEG
jgi:hypothetical protein